MRRRSAPTPRARKAESPPAGDPRNFGPSCQAKRAALFAEKLAGEILAPVPHRHVAFTIPKALRGMFERERKLLGLLPRCAFRAVRLLYQEPFNRPNALPGMVASIQTFGSALNFHPHVRALAMAASDSGTSSPMTVLQVVAIVGSALDRAIPEFLRGAARLCRVGQDADRTGRADDPATTCGNTPAFAATSVLAVREELISAGVEMLEELESLR